MRKLKPILVKTEQMKEKQRKPSKVERMAEIIEEILELNPAAAIAGSCAMNIHGLNRTINDLDFAIPALIRVKVPEGATEVKVGSYSYSRQIASFKYKGVKIDFLKTSSYRPQRIDGIKVTSLQEIAEAKLTYIQDFSTSKEQVEKHQRDVNMIFKYMLDKRLVRNEF